MESLSQIYSGPEPVCVWREQREDPGPTGLTATGEFLGKEIALKDEENRGVLRTRTERGRELAFRLEKDKGVSWQ